MAAFGIITVRNGNTGSASREYNESEKLGSAKCHLWQRLHSRACRHHCFAQHQIQLSRPHTAHLNQKPPFNGRLYCARVASLARRFARYQPNGRPAPAEHLKSEHDRLRSGGPDLLSAPRSSSARNTFPRWSSARLPRRADPRGHAKIFPKRYSVSHPASHCSPPRSARGCNAVSAGRWVPDC